MKKILAVILVLATIAALGGCMPSSATKTVKATDPAEPDKIVHTNYDCSLDGLCNYLDDLGYMVFDYDASKDEAGSTILMDAAMIGAEKGYKSTYTYNNENWAVEVYYYTNLTSDMYYKAQDGKIVLDENLDNGTFEIKVNHSFGLVVHAPKNAEERKSEIIKAFTAFYPDGTPRG